jgi:hypothetical protein
VLSFAIPNFRCAAEQNTVLLVAIPKNFSAQQNEMSQFELFWLANSESFRCAAEQNTVNLSASVGKFLNLGCASEQNAVV